ncbi:MAG TPA: contractile injection system protein, VgrG/Pvc8 family [Myxococcales bacterium]
MPNDDDAHFEDARPTVYVDGEEKDDLRQGMLSLLVAESADGMSRCEICFGNQGSQGQGVDFLYFDRKTLDFGKSVRIAYKGDLFEGRITALEARFPKKSPPEIMVLAEDALQDLRMVRRTRSFENQSDADVFSAIATDHGMDKDVNLPGDKHKLLAQVNQSDLAFLRDRARAIEAELWISMSNGKAKLSAKARAGRQSTSSVTLGLHNELTEFTVLADLATQRTSVIASGWDVSSKAAVKYESTDSDLGSETQGADSGAAILKKSFGERKESVAHGVPWTAGEAEARAKGYLKATARKFVVGHGVARTTGDLRVGKVVDLDGLGPLFNGKYYLASVRHRFDGKSGLRTEIAAERAALGRP